MNSRKTVAKSVGQGLRAALVAALLALFLAGCTQYHYVAEDVMIVDEPTRGAVYHAPPPFVWAYPYWTSHWYYADPWLAHRHPWVWGGSPWRHAYTSLYYPWYGWSPRWSGAYPHPWNAAYGPGFRSWVYTPPFGDADGSDFVFANPGPGQPAGGIVVPYSGGRSARASGSLPATFDASWFDRSVRSRGWTTSERIVDHNLGGNAQGTTIARSRGSEKISVSRAGAVKSISRLEHYRSPQSVRPTTSQSRSFSSGSSSATRSTSSRSTSTRSARSAKPRSPVRATLPSTGTSSRR